MKITRRKFAALAGTAAVAATLALAGCGGSGSDAPSADDDTIIKIGACTTPHAEILEDVVAPALAAEGYTLEVQIIDDYSLPNRLLHEGEIDANYFQHQPYLDEENASQGYDIVPVTAVHYEPFGLYSSQITSLDQLKDGDKIAVPNDPTNEARALLLLEQAGIIVLDPEAGLTATVTDIEEYKVKVEIYEIDAELTARELEEAAICAINSNYAVNAGLNPTLDALLYEDTQSDAAQTYQNILAVNNGQQDSPKIQALAAALNSDEVRTYINDKYNGACLPVF